MSRPRHTRLAGVRARDLRRRETISETRLWQALRRRQMGVRFRRQVPIGIYIADFACVDPRIVIEVDDKSHYWKDEEARMAYLESCGFVVLAVTNRDVAMKYDSTVDWLQRCVDWIVRNRAAGPAELDEQGLGEGDGDPG